ncbi:hypothetical protein HPB50_004871 [Hyalomma asiaticum]|uniref:Uncharacterized protein n=1 Tax=Hyalomma asiaticum TaxID=266040 RepID=A0ACB7T3I0_HYAAI|nr:hypothetical protein HPB50_004871 [Hyalomma asiaticum]
MCDISARMHCLAERRSKIGQTVTGKHANAMRVSNSIATATARPTLATPRAFVWFAARPESSEETRASLSPRFPPCATEPSDESYVAPSGQQFWPPGTPCGRGLCMEAGLQMGLKKGTPVATSIIDAHAGGLGLLGCEAQGEFFKSFSRRLAVIAGTSTCHMLANENSIFTPGVWGPYFSAMVPGMWLSEAGQSAAGALVDHVISTHPAYPKIVEKTKPGRRPEDTLNAMLLTMCEQRGLDSPSQLVTDLHVWPDFHGNRSPVADPGLRGMISGLTLSAGEEDLAKLYLATLQALAYGTRHIMDALAETGHSVSSLLMCGGMAKNPFYVEVHADATGMPVLLPSETESVLLGGAILAASASGRYKSVTEAMLGMGGSGKVIAPRASERRFHDAKYAAFRALLDCQLRLREIMSPNGRPPSSCS